MIRYFGLSLVGLLLAGCGGDDPEISCSGNGGCARGEFCSTSGECQPLADNSFAGTFRCVPGTASDPPISLESDVVGKLFGEDVTLNATAVCHYDDSALIVSAVGADQTQVSMYTTAPQVSNVLDGFNFLNTAFGFVGRGNNIGSSTPALLLLTDGVFTLDGAPTAGKPLTVHVEVRGVSPAPQSTAGIPCSVGTECGGYFFSESVCAYSESDTFCLADCTTDADCGAFGAQICDDGTCFRSCTADTDCVGKQRCLSLPNGNMCR
ncbi:MAG: hypothetical protein H6718_10705 [Polyangiaceae bacterium]|nr:hypothetical protein [Myxococcales bacterium]MCB9585857.1 hypothetical protein [Polyangiaceae bacterium]MCB9607214.1 hypothetical protein [Polyangiaceae bacterium]